MNPKDLLDQNIIDTLIYPILVIWSDDSKEVIDGTTILTSAKYLGNMDKRKDRPYIKSVEILKDPGAKILYGTNK